MFNQEVYEWGLSVIRAFQSASSPFLDAFVKALTHIGGPATAILIIFFVYWCVDSKKGFKLFFLTFIAFALNICLKNAFKIPRPFIVDPSLQLIAETGFSTPSGHAQGSAAFWTLFAAICLQKRKKTGLALALCVPFAASLTRIYLGVHYPTDVLLGLIVGYLCALGGIIFYDPIAQKIIRLSRPLKILAIALVCLIANRFSGGDITASATLFGFVFGYICIAGYLMPDAKKNNSLAGDFVFPLKQKALRFIVGGFLCGVVYAALKYIAILWNSEANKALIDFIRYAAAGWTASFLVFKCFKKIKILSRVDFAA